MYVFEEYKRFILYNHRYSKTNVNYDNFVDYPVSSMNLDALKELITYIITKML